MAFAFLKLKENFGFLYKEMLIYVIYLHYMQIYWRILRIFYIAQMRINGFFKMKLFVLKCEKDCVTLSMRLCTNP